MAGLETLAFAKVNLTLHVGPPKPNGRHDLDSLVVFAGPEAADRLRVAPADVLSLEVSGPRADAIGPVDGNLVLRAAHALQARGGVRDGAAFVLGKRLPAAAGIGGGSADAGAALRLLSGLWGVEDDDLLMDVAAGLGGDVPAALMSRPLMMRGEGERVTPVDWPMGVPAVLINPGVGCPTGPVFSRYDTFSPPDLEHQDVPAWRRFDDLFDWLATTRNDLERPAIDLAPVVGRALDALGAQNGAALARMSGSGATCFALFHDQEAALSAARALQASEPEWWIVSTTLGPAT